MRKANIILLLMVHFVFPGAAKGEPLQVESVINEIRTGIMAHDVAIRAKKHEGGQDFNGEFFFRSPRVKLMRHIGSPRPSIGISINNLSQTSQFYSGLNWQLSFLDRFFVGLGLGAAVHNGELQSSDPDRQRLGSRALFRYSVVAGFNINKRLNVSALFDHVSNGHLAYPNNGLEKFGIQIGYSY